MLELVRKAARQLLPPGAGPAEEAGTRIRRVCRSHPCGPGIPELRIGRVGRDREDVAAVEARSGSRPRPAAVATPRRPEPGALVDVLAAERVEGQVVAVEADSPAQYAPMCDRRPRCAESGRPRFQPGSCPLSRATRRAPARRVCAASPPAGASTTGAGRGTPRARSTSPRRRTRREGREASSRRRRRRRSRPRAPSRSLLPARTATTSRRRRPSGTPPGPACPRTSSPHLRRRATARPRPPALGRPASQGPPRLPRFPCASLRRASSSGLEHTALGDGWVSVDHGEGV